MSGKLYLVATPIGNLGDITLRALDVLKCADVVACEDTRRTLGLLTHFEIKKPLISYYKGKEREGAEKILSILSEGKNVAVVSDAGMPGISDPGIYLVREAMLQGVPYTVIPGACAFVTATALAGVEQPYTFIGFLPEKKKDRDNLLEEYKNSSAKLIFYCAPHDLNETLKYLAEAFGKRDVYLVKEITKMYEGVTMGVLGVDYVDNPKGEYVIIVCGKEKVITEASDEEIKAELTHLISQGIDKKQAISDTAKKYDISKNTVYKLSIDL
ncbi:MAG TPA: 16S rRNA (cytidine(1402)-2'-O)-methyltransferase [Clostridia bacterium]|jgi:16S rRNA (cytidine1402-2'-O)-methyltransferase|nr:16S rRNA (cytidine(1402)-2'-O)-methyltransferase [Clostridia bacterium]